MFSSHTCHQKPLRFTDVDGKIGVFVVVTFVLLHRLCHSNIPKLNLQKNEQNKDGEMMVICFTGLFC